MHISVHLSHTIKNKWLGSIDPLHLSGSYRAEGEN
jgi:hypothetical protein